MRVIRILFYVLFQISDSKSVYISISYFLVDFYYHTDTLNTLLYSLHPEVDVFIIF